MQPCPGCLGQQDIPGDDRLLGDRRPAAQPEDGGDRALVHLRVLGEPRLLRVLGDDTVFVHVHDADTVFVLGQARRGAGAIREGERHHRRQNAEKIG